MDLLANTFYYSKATGGENGLATILCLYQLFCCLFVKRFFGFFSHPAKWKVLEIPTEPISVLNQVSSEMITSMLFAGSEQMGSIGR